MRNRYPYQTPQDPFGAVEEGEKDLSISIVTFNSAHMICQCLESIYSHDHRFSYEVLVVDNNSLDETVLTIQERYPQIRLIRNQRNLGYARATNQAIERSCGKYVLIINPDIVVLKDSLEKMLAHMEAHPDVGVTGCRLIYPNGILQLSCRRFPTLTTFLLRGTRIGDIFPHIGVLEEYLLEKEDHQRMLDVDWCLGSCLMARREALDAVGKLDGNFFLYYEDIDLCYRMKRKRWRVSYVPSAEMIHHYRRLSASLIPNQYTMHHLKSAVYFFWKHRKERRSRTII